MSGSEEDVPAGYWAAFGYQNHLIPVGETRRVKAGRLAGLCGVMTTQDGVGEYDGRLTCSVCSEHVREGRYRSVAPPW